MKKFRKYFLTTQSSLLAVLLGMLGVNISCNHSNYTTEYGCKSATYIIKGHVKSESTENAIQNIQVRNNLYDTSVYSDTNGYYKLTPELKTSVSGSHSVKFVLHFRDIDSTQNGNFQDMDTSVEFDNPQFINGNSGGYIGEASKEFNIVLKPKK